MIEYNGKVYRNLEEQVLKNQEDIELILRAKKILSEISIKVVGEVESEDELPDVTTYTGNIGDAYAVGEDEPYDFYVYLADDTLTEGYTWFNIGTLKGPRGFGILYIAKTATEGLVDTYTVTYDDGDTWTYTVTNGADGASISQIQLINASGITVVYDGAKARISGTGTLTFDDSTTRDIDSRIVIPIAGSGLIGVDANEAGTGLDVHIDTTGAVYGQVIGKTADGVGWVNQTGGSGGHISEIDLDQRVQVQTSAAHGFDIVGDASITYPDGISTADFTVALPIATDGKIEAQVDSVNSAVVFSLDETAFDHIVSASISDNTLTLTGYKDDTAVTRTYTPSCLVNARATSGGMLELINNAGTTLQYNPDRIAYAIITSNGDHLTLLNKDLESINYDPNRTKQVSVDGDTLTIVNRVNGTDSTITYSPVADEAITDVSYEDGTMTVTHHDESTDTYDILPSVDGELGRYLKVGSTGPLWVDSPVEANPTGTTSNTLSKIKINNTIYNIEGGGGGGGSLTPNPTYDSTKYQGNLNRIETNNLQYSIPSTAYTTTNPDGAHANQIYSIIYNGNAGGSALTYYPPTISAQVGGFSGTDNNASITQLANGQTYYNVPHMPKPIRKFGMGAVIEESFEEKNKGVSMVINADQYVSASTATGSMTPYVTVEVMSWSGVVSRFNIRPYAYGSGDETEATWDDVKQFRFLGSEFYSGLWNTGAILYDGAIRELETHQRLERDYADHPEYPALYLRPNTWYESVAAGNIELPSGNDPIGPYISLLIKDAPHQQVIPSESTVDLREIGNNYVRNQNGTFTSSTPNSARGLYITDNSGHADVQSISIEVMNHDGIIKQYQLTRKSDEGYLFAYITDVDRFRIVSYDIGQGSGDWYLEGGDAIDEVNSYVETDTTTISSQIWYKINNTTGDTQSYMTGENLNAIELQYQGG